MAQVGHRDVHATLVVFKPVIFKRPCHVPGFGGRRDRPQACILFWVYQPTDSPPRRLRVCTFDRAVYTCRSVGLAPTLLRLAWHASGTYSAKDGMGGSNGATMRFQAEVRAHQRKSATVGYGDHYNTTACVLLRPLWGVCSDHYYTIACVLLQPLRGCRQASSGANQGLMLARRMLEPIKSRYAGLTYADLWTFAVSCNQP